MQVSKRHETAKGTLLDTRDEHQDTELLKRTPPIKPIKIFGTYVAPNQPSIVRTESNLRNPVPAGQSALSYDQEAIRLEGGVNHELLRGGLRPRPSALPQVSQHAAGVSRVQGATFAPQHEVTDPKTISAILDRFNELMARRILTPAEQDEAKELELIVRGLLYTRSG